MKQQEDATTNVDYLNTKQQDSSKQCDFVKKKLIIVQRVFVKVFKGIKFAIVNVINDFKKGNFKANFKAKISYAVHVILQLKSPQNRREIFLYIKTKCLQIALRCFFFCKNKWLKLVDNAMDRDNKYGKKRVLWMFLIGFCNFIATPPFNIIFVLPVTFGTLFFILNEEQKTIASFSTRLATIFFFLFGYFVSVFWWLFVPLTTDIARFFWIIPFAILGLPCSMALIFLLFFAVGIKIYDKIFTFQKLKNNETSNIADIVFLIIFLFCWFLGDYVRGHIIFGGFPWMLFGHFVPYSFAFQAVRLFGIDIYSIFFLLLVLAPYFLIFKKNNNLLRNFSLTIIVLWIINCFVGLLIILIHQNSTIKTTIVGSQINHPASLDMENNAVQIINENLQNLSWIPKNTRDMILLMPEGSVNAPLNSGDLNTITIGKVIPNDNSILLAGGIYFDGVSPYNVIYSINHAGHIVSMYKKQKLVPFGEYIPFHNLFPILVRNVTGGMLDFITDGENDLYTLYRNLPIIYPIVCYESIFPNLIKKHIRDSRKFISTINNDHVLDKRGFEDAKNREELIVNLTNDAWMKWSIAPYQHFRMTRFLAVSTGLPVARLSNNGISAFIDKFGRVLYKTTLNKKDVLFVPRNKKL